MVIVFVEDNYKNLTDGTSISAYRFRNELIKRGHTVRVLAVDVSGEDMYGLEEHHVPLVSEVASKNHQHFAKYDEKIVRRAFEGADIVHIFFPWQIARKCYRLAREMGIPVSGAFHCQPENVTYNMMIPYFEPANIFVYFLFKFWFYRKVDNIHCPSLFTSRELQKHGYHARLHAISNGVSDAFRPPDKPVQKTGDRIRLLMIGRIAEEKRQDLIINAVNISKYRDKIEIFFAGQGPMQKRFTRYARKLPNKPRFEFVSQERLLDIIYNTDIYIHASDAETEGISCLEAISCGKVPIISDSKKSAASQFSLDGRSLFKRGSYRDLCKKLEYWIEHPDERKRMETEYIELGKKYHISYSIDKIEKMFDDTIKGYRTEKMIRKDAELRKYYNRVRRGNRVKEFFCSTFYFIAIIFLAIINRVFFGLKIKNRKALKKIKKTGAITICNHVHQMDCTACAVAFGWRRLLFVSLPSNFKLGVAGIFVDILGSVPTPSGPKETQIFIQTLSKMLRKGRIAHFYPEGERKNYDTEIRDFNRGPFYLAVDAQKPVVPIRIVFRKPDGVWKLFRKKPCFTLVVGDPVYPDTLLSPKAAIEDIQIRARKSMIALSDPPPPPPVSLNLLHKIPAPSFHGKRGVYKLKSLHPLLKPRLGLRALRRFAAKQRTEL
jgi:glycosyltransferase involved in cell wall biosynthesis/1-acyl-sn-glycerol-3-phosphate acyltransferase